MVRAAKVDGTSRHTGNGADRTSGVARLGDRSTQWEFFTPPKAEAALAEADRNRHLMDSYAQTLALDQTNGDWFVTHQGLAFSTGNKLVDGQHRLRAVVLSGVGQWFLVTRGLDSQAIEAMDRGRLRSLAHTMQIMGFDLASNRITAIARSMMAGPQANPTHTRPTAVMIRKFILQHQEALLFADSNLGKTFGPAPIAAVLARAYYHAGITALTRFCRAARDEIPTEELQQGDGSARKLQRSTRRSTSRGARLTGVSAYRRTQTVLAAYLRGEDISQVRETTEDLYPLPQAATGENDQCNPGEA